MSGGNYWPKVAAKDQGEVTANLGGAGDYTIAPEDFFVAIDCTADSVDVFLPPAAESQDRLLLILPRNATSNAVILNPHPADATPLVNGSPSYNSQFSESGEIHFLECDGAVWHVRVPWARDDILEVLSIADLADISGVTGSGDVAVLQLGPIIALPTIVNAIPPTGPGFLLSNHDHSDAPNGGQLVGVDALSDATTTPTASSIPVSNGSGKLAAGWLSEVLALADLSDVSAKTGTGSTVVMDTSPTIGTPTIASMVNANHNHQNAAGGGQLDHGLALTGLGDDDHTQYMLLAGRSGGQTLVGGSAGSDDLTLRSTSALVKGTITVENPFLLSDQSANPTNTGRFQRNGATLKFHDGTAARALLDDADAMGGDVTGTFGANTVLTGSTSQAGKLQLDADNGENAARAVNGQDTRLVRRGTSFPGSPADGWHYYRTDLDELFEYDGTRAKWLSVREFTYEGAHTNVNNTYLNMPGGPVFSSTIGWGLPFDMTLCEIHITNATAVTGTFRIRANGSNVNAWTQAQGSGVTTALNDNFTAADVVSFFTSSNISAGCAVKAIMRRRAS